jgi:hypothetical protein
MRATEGHEGVGQRWDVYMRKVKAADSDSVSLAGQFGAGPSPSPTRSNHHTVKSPGSICQW